MSAHTPRPWEVGHTEQTKMKTCNLYEIRKWDEAGYSSRLSFKLRSRVRAQRLVARLRSRNIPCFAAAVKAGAA